MSGLNFTDLRKQFPILQERTYLATHTLGPLPQNALVDLAEYTSSLYLGRRALSIWLEQYARIFPLIENLLNAPRDSIALFPNTTAAQGAIAAAIAPQPKQRRIIIADGDFPSSRYLWTSQVQRGFEITEIQISDRKYIESDDVIAQIDESVAIVAVSLVSYLNSGRLNIQPIVEAAHQVGAIVVLDAYQAVGIIPLDIAALEVDVLVGGMNKWLCGGVGLAFAYIKPSLAAQLTPVYPGWFAHQQPTAFADTFIPATGARRFQQGTPSIEPIYTSRAGLQFVLDVGVKNIHQRNIELTNYLLELAEEYRIPVCTPKSPQNRGGTICLAVEGAAQIVQKLSDLGIDIDNRSSNKIRISPHFCNTINDCQHLMTKLAQLISVPVLI